MKRGVYQMESKQVWVKADEGAWEERKKRVTNALESGADVVLVNEDDVLLVRELGRIKVAAFVSSAASRSNDADADILVVGKEGEGDGTIPLPGDTASSEDLGRLKQLAGDGRGSASYVVIKGKKYETFAAEVGSSADNLIVIGTDWKVIPLENIIAELHKKDVNIIAGVRDAEEAKLALETLEHGAHGILLDSDDPSELKRIIEFINQRFSPKAQLEPARVTTVRQLSMGDRVCVDTCSMMAPGEGMLVGSQSDVLFLVHSESEESPYVASRPFRVNAGAVHSYILVGDKTRYLSELSAGDEALVVGFDGSTRKAVVGRVKIERRPLILVEAEIGGRTAKIILQNAETIKLVRPDGSSVSVAELKEGDEIMVRIEGSARHFGMKVDETILEK